MSQPLLLDAVRALQDCIAYIDTQTSGRRPKCVVAAQLVLSRAASAMESVDEDFSEVIQGDPPKVLLTMSLPVRNEGTAYVKAHIDAPEFLSSAETRIKTCEQMRRAMQRLLDRYNEGRK